MTYYFQSMKLLCSKDHGYLVASGVGCCLVVQALGLRVSHARRKYNVEYPIMYNDNKTFNCIQRSHQHSLEELPTMLYLMTAGGIEYPKLAASLGALWIAGRIVFAIGYSTGDPSKRNWGHFGCLGTLGVLGLSVINVLNWLDISKIELGRKKKECPKK